MMHRNPFGAMCGRYCAAAVNYHKYLNCANGSEKQKALLDSARLIYDVRKTYDEIYSSTVRIFRTWNKIHNLLLGIHEALPEDSKGDLSVFYGIDEPYQTGVNIFTPLH
jgi:hypothetical protein